ncbi:glycosyltransferase family 4 protein [Microbacterium rhizomatis]|uniref:Glycosyltransferase family 4 protein n=1 Tax=Microbacterium rhizomatis TaxID=1631477 RepID=A0A5J5J3K7_9MICO|nr:glycosyltransferase family 4 protein [Microbacterium rhizomatis]KAA9107798.1 glycosyltransferase family 4 protein [Microbacterium rhizomatis]
MSFERTLVRATFVSSAVDAWGAEESLLTLARYLPDFGVVPTLWTRNANLVTRWVSEVGAPAQLMPPAEGGRIADALWWARHADSVDPTAARPDVKVIFSIDLAPLAAMGIFGRGRPAAVLDLHDFLPTRAGRLKLKVAASAFDGVIAISAFAASQLQPRASTAVLGRPIADSESTVSRRSAEPDRGRVGIVGRIDPDKNLELALRALARLPETVRLIIKGTASSAGTAYERAFKSLAETTLGDRVIFTGRVNNSTAMDGIDALLVTNGREALGRTILEAQLRGVPVAVPSVGGASELVVDGQTGYVFDPADDRAAAHAIQNALTADIELIERSRDAAIRRTDPRAYAKQYAKYLRDISQRRL